MYHFLCHKTMCTFLGFFLVVSNVFVPLILFLAAHKNTAFSPVRGEIMTGLRRKKETSMWHVHRYYYWNSPFEGPNLKYVMAGSTDMHRQCKVEHICVRTEYFSTKRQNAISPHLHCETTAVPFTMANRLIFIPLFYLHIMQSEMGFACIKSVSQKAQCAPSRMNAAGGCTPLGKH